jgi:hypothetical protein
MVNVLESTLEWTLGELIIDTGIHRSHTPCFSLDSASGFNILYDVRYGYIPTSMAA